MTYDHYVALKPEEAATTTSLWKQTSLADDSDGKMSAKFRRLMGMKDDGKKLEIAEKINQCLCKCNWQVTNFCFN